MNRFFLLFAAAVIGVAADQDAPYIATPHIAPETTGVQTITKTVKVDELTLAKLENIELRKLVKLLKAEKAQCEYSLNQPATVESSFQPEMVSIIQDAYKRAGLSQAEYSIDPQTLTFVKKPTPAPAPAENNGN